MQLQPTLIGSSLVLTPLQPDDWPALAQAASDPLIWQLHPEPERYKPEVFRPVFESGLASGSAFTIRDKHSGEVLGTTRYYELVPPLAGDGDGSAANSDCDGGSVAIGYTFLVRSRWGGSTNTELKQLMLQHAFASVDTVWFHVGSENFRSQKAVQKLGAVFSHSEIKAPTGVPRETYCYRLAKTVWLARHDSVSIDSVSTAPESVIQQQ